MRAEKNIVSRDKVINELRLRLPATANRERLLADIAKHEEGQSDSQPALKLAQQSIKDLQGRLDKKEDVLKKCQSQLAQARRVQWHWGTKYNMILSEAKSVLVLKNAKQMISACGANIY